ncbi:aminopeptidase P N-terminal domain-containing protein [Candidatus Poribacteria bacterium]|nr:aminopeptidase P N-terminal domain-containing protein [Candidatus Poribacteria bacterium]
MHKRKREALMQRIKGGVAIFPSAPPVMRNYDTEHKYRQDSNFYYLTGFEEPGAVCVIAPDHPEHQYVLFVRPRDPKRETWTGRRAGVDGAKAHFGADEAYPIEEFDEKISGYIEKAEVLYYSFESDEAFNQKIINIFKRANRLRLRGGKGPNTLTDSMEILAEMRLIKDGEELKRVRRATEVSVEAHIAAMKVACPGMYEYELEALIDSIFRHNDGYAAFPTIVASGVNATILHYTTNDCQIQDGDLLLIDAGCEYKYYNGDITRTFPANGKFTEPQREIYQLVLDVELAIIEAIRPGVSIGEPNKKAVELLTEEMLKFGLLEGEKEKLIEEKGYKKFYMHRVGHMIGIDVHDINKIKDGEEHKTFQPGMVTTVEPGLYIPVDSENVDPKYLGIGVRIEDDILVTESGCEVLTAQVPKTIEEIEQLMNQARSA